MNTMSNKSNTVNPDTSDATATETDTPDFGNFADNVREYHEAVKSGDRSAYGKIRTNMRNTATQAVRDARNATGQKRLEAMERAFTAQAALDAMVTRTVIEAKTVDYPQLTANYIASLRNAADRLESGEATLSYPDDVTVDVTDLPDGEVDSDIVTKLVNHRIGRKTYSGPRGNVDNHIVEAIRTFDRFAKVSEIANFKSDEYGDRNVSPGAVGAALSKMRDGDREVPEGIMWAVDDNGRLGARPA